MGCLKKRVQPEDVVINCSKGVHIPPPKGHKWKEIRHDNTVSKQIMSSISFVRSHGFVLGLKMFSAVTNTSC